MRIITINAMKSGSFNPRVDASRSPHEVTHCTATEANNVTRSSALCRNRVTMPERLTLVIVDSAPAMEIANAHAIMRKLATCLPDLPETHLIALGRALFEFAVSESARHNAEEAL